ALMSVLIQIFAGALSDRATFHLGRRRPFIMGGMLVGLFGLYLMGHAHSLATLAGAFLVLQLGFSFGQSAYAALIPDRVPAEQRGGASGLIGLMALLGSIVAAIVAGKVVKEGSYASFATMYWIIIVIQLLLTTTTTLTIREDPLQLSEPFKVGSFLA